MFRAIKAILKFFIPPFFISAYHYGLAFFAALLYRFPSRKLTVIGVTGTDGKSTTVEMITSVLRAGGFKVASTSSIHFLIGDTVWKNTLKMGMPGRFFLQRFLRKAVNEGCTHAVIEVSSEGVIQHRHRFVKFHTAVWTNLFPEHIERHGSFKNYLNAKRAFVSAARDVHVLNADDEYFPHFVRPGWASRGTPQESDGYSMRRVFAFGTKERATDIRAEYVQAADIQELTDGVTFHTLGHEFSLKLLGRVNVYNALAALCVGISQGISLDMIAEGLRRVERMPGRMDVIIKKPFSVMVDYAVTPKALRNLYETARRIFKPERLICVFGACGGGRDAWKRPMLGKIASEYCSAIILTNEDPYDEDPDQILAQIESGIYKSQITNHKQVVKILDRREAIRKALELARPGDMAVLSGKGSEDAIAAARGKKIPWSEEQVVLEEFQKLKN